MARLTRPRPITNLFSTDKDKGGDQVACLDRTESLPPSSGQAGVQRSQQLIRIPFARRHKRKQRSRRSRVRRWLLRCSLILMLGLLLLTQANGAFGAWAADALRSVLGPQITAQIESWYLGMTDTVHQLTYHLGGQQASVPWKVGPTPTIGRTAPAATPTPPPMSLVSIPSAITPALDGEGIWTTDGVPASPPGLPPLVAKTFLRPDPARPYAIATLLQFDLRHLALHMVAGTSQPGGPQGIAGPGAISPSDQQGNLLLAAFNGGFKYADGHYGMMADGTVYVPPQQGQATVAVTKSGQVLLGAWGVDPGFTSGNSNLMAWRQNCALLIDQGTINPLTQDGVAWGGTILNSAYTWRSGLGLTANGTLLYVAGNSLSAETLGKALKAAGAVMAMQLDINPFWVRAFLYERDAAGTLHTMKLNPAMQGNALDYLRGTQRDFFYLTIIPPRPSRPGQ